MQSKIVRGDSMQVRRNKFEHARNLVQIAAFSLSLERVCEITANLQTVYKSDKNAVEIAGRVARQNRP